MRVFHHTFQRQRRAHTCRRMVKRKRSQHIEIWPPASQDATCHQHDQTVLDSHIWKTPNSPGSLGFSVLLDEGASLAVASGETFVSILSPIRMLCGGRTTLSNYVLSTPTRKTGIANSHNERCHLTHTFNHTPSGNIVRVHKAVPRKAKTRQV